ncbi:B-cell receptor CD22-like [Sphaeramia orbicularis]|uniref:B-cell receptor CD22-like n=1 Tax=Sphaeramia orbicularis TaxID=375764 RepID=UPI00117F0B75|nr:B-cell receptor CD22-like [Sphaeramia orbicularis]
MSCTYTYPQWINKQKTTAEKSFWFINSDINPVDLKTESEYKGRVHYPDNKNHCEVRISDLRQSDSAQYHFSFIINQPGGRYTGSPGVTLTVTDLQVHVTRSSSCGNSNCVQVELRCHSSCRLPDNYKYTWFKNRQKIQSETSSSYSTSFSSEDTVSCAVKLGSEMFSSPPVFAPTVPSVSFSPSGEIIEGRSVTLTCTSDANPPVTKYTWYKRGKNRLQSRGQQFVLSFINSSDSGSYSCVAENSLGLKMSEYVYIDVKYKTFIQYSLPMNIIKVMLVGLLPIALIFLTVWKRKKKTQNLNTGLNPPENMVLQSDPDYVNVSALKSVTAAKREDSQEQESVM